MLSEKDSVAVRAPWPPGVNVKATAQVPPEPVTWPALTHEVLASIAKSPAFVPLTGVPVIVTVMGVLPALIRNTERAVDFWPTVWFPKSSVVVETLTTEGSPTPLRGTLRGLPGPSSVNVSVAVAAPSAVGVKMMSTTQVVRALTVPPLKQVEVGAREKIVPPVVIVAMCKSRVERFERMIRCGGLVVLIISPPKVRIGFDNVTGPGTPVPVRLATSGLPAAPVKLMVAVADLAPRAVGVNVMLTRQLVFAGTTPPGAQLESRVAPKSAVLVPPMTILLTVMEAFVPL